MSHITAVVMCTLLSQLPSAGLTYFNIRHLPAYLALDVGITGMSAVLGLHSKLPNTADGMQKVEGGRAEGVNVCFHVQCLQVDPQNE